MQKVACKKDFAKTGILNVEIALVLKNRTLKIGKLVKVRSIYLVSMLYILSVLKYNKEQNLTWYS